MTPVPLPQGRMQMPAGAQSGGGKLPALRPVPQGYIHGRSAELPLDVEADLEGGPAVNVKHLLLGAGAGYAVGGPVGALAGGIVAHILGKRSSQHAYQMPDNTVGYGATYGDACSRWQRKYERYARKGGKRRDKWADKNYSKAAAAGCAWTQPEGVQQMLQGQMPDVTSYQTQGYQEAMAAAGGTGVGGGNAASPVLLVAGLGAAALGLIYMFTR
jgi:hypothetical protein